MSESANVRAINSLDELRGALVQFRTEAQESLQAAAQEISRTLDWLAERKQRWQNEVRRREEIVQAARAALARCEASGYRDEDGRYHQPDCSSQQNALLQAQVYLREAEAELRTVYGWINHVQQAADAYQQRARQLNDYLANDMTKATALLGSSADTLRSYTAMSAGLSEGLDTLQASATVDTGLLGQNTPTAEEAILTHEHRGITWQIKIVPRSGEKGVDVYISGKDPDTYPHIHAFYPDWSNQKQIAVLSLPSGDHIRLSDLFRPEMQDLVGGFPHYVLDLLANLPNSSSFSPSAPPEFREGSVGGPERKG